MESGQDHEVNPHTEQVNEKAQAEQNLITIIREIDSYRIAAKDQLQIALNSYLNLLEPQGLEEKKQVANLLNSIIKRLGLNIEYQNMPCTIYATSSPKSRNGRFKINISGTSNALMEPTSLSGILPINLTCSIQPTLPNFSKPSHQTSTWQDKVGSEPPQNRKNLKP